MGYHIGDCPKCNARLLIEYKDANKYDEVDFESSTVELTYVARCWKCGAIVKAVIVSNLEEIPMEIEIADILVHFHKIVPTRNLSKSEKMESS